ncbi:MAG TPA: hypothetical protein VFU15_05095 [Bacteroidia bacterium]|nr:hypothetical protein [Bacteroidia bacterium]
MLFLLSAYIFRGSIYRACFSYKLVRLRSEATPPYALSVTGQDIQGIAEAGLEGSSALLSFTTGPCATGVPKLQYGGKTNCIGYSNLCAGICEMKFRANPSLKDARAETWVAQIFFFGWNVHRLFSDPFWKDHDVVLLTDGAAGDRILLDPTLYDYTGIGFVRERK